MGNAYEKWIKQFKKYVMNENSTLSNLKGWLLVDLWSKGMQCMWWCKWLYDLGGNLGSYDLGGKFRVWMRLYILKLYGLSHYPLDSQFVTRV